MNAHIRLACALAVAGWIGSPSAAGEPGRESRHAALGSALALADRERHRVRFARATEARPNANAALTTPCAPGGNVAA